MSQPLRSPAPLRISGKGPHPPQLMEGLPPGCRLTPEGLILPDTTEIGSARYRLMISLPRSVDLPAGSRRQSRRRRWFGLNEISCHLARIIGMPYFTGGISG
jgi:hypothetical protein